MLAHSRQQTLWMSQTFIQIFVCLAVKWFVYHNLKYAKIISKFKGEINFIY